MWKADINGLVPMGASRPRFNPLAGFVYTLPKYAKYKKQLVARFDEFADDADLRECFEECLYGLSIKIVYRAPRYGSKAAFNRRKPDADNLYKATIDALFESKVNQREFVRYKTKKTTGELVMQDGEPVGVYKHWIDDSNVIHADIWKMNANSEAEIGQTITIARIGFDTI